MSDWVSDWLIDWVSECSIDWLGVWLIDWLIFVNLFLICLLTVFQWVFIYFCSVFSQKHFCVLFQCLNEPGFRRRASSFSTRLTASSRNAENRATRVVWWIGSCPSWWRKWTDSHGTVAFSYSAPQIGPILSIPLYSDPEGGKKKSKKQNQFSISSLKKSEAGKKNSKIQNQLNFSSLEKSEPGTKNLKFKIS